MCMHSVFTSLLLSKLIIPRTRRPMTRDVSIIKYFIGSGVVGQRKIKQDTFNVVL